MSNTWFKFKQFTIEQKNASMKVGTDGVLLGAWADVQGAEKILDIGTGTGLISLMLAQRSNAMIDAIEIDPRSAEQAEKNAASSPWNNRINIMCVSLQEYSAGSGKLYDRIVCNPPYFSRSLQSGNRSRDQSRHDVALTREDLILGISKLISVNGTFSVILPFSDGESMIKDAGLAGFFPGRIMKVRPLIDRNFHRILLEFGRAHITLSESEMAIEISERHRFSEEYMKLTGDFYLKF